MEEKTYLEIIADDGNEAQKLVTVCRSKSCYPLPIHTWFRSFEIRHYATKHRLMRYNQYFCLREQGLYNIVDTL